MREWPSHPIIHFEGRPLPEPGIPVGYAALIDVYALSAPLPSRLTATARRHHPISSDDWLMLTPRHRPEDTLVGHLAFALRWEGIDLSVLSALFEQMELTEFEAYVRETPTGAAARRLWFLYEWLTGARLEVPDAGKVRLTPVVDPDMQFALGVGIPSPRHKVLNNLPGTPSFCPMVRRTPALIVGGASQYDVKAREVIGRTRRDIVSRAAAFLVLKDSKSSFAIERERPTGNRTARWAQAIGQAGTRSLSIAEFERLQRIVVDDRLVRLGLRREGGFVGEHDRDTSDPIPDHISARHDDLVSLMEGLVAYSERAVSRGADAVVTAAALAFGFVYIHPFIDGNGRLHRWLIHHVLAISGYSPPGLVFPISAAILRQIETYREVLESYSRPLLPLIEWRPTPGHNVEVLNDTARYYRYFDATKHAEFLYDCVARTVEHDLPEEVAFLEAYDQFNESVQQVVDMPSRSVELLRKFLEQGNGRLSARARGNEFAMLSMEECDAIEQIYANTLQNCAPDGPRR